MGGGEDLLPAHRDPEGEGSLAGHAGDLPMTGPAQSRTTDIVPGPGGVMTDEVGVVTGDLTLRSELTGKEVALRVQYKDAEEWYTVTGGRATIADPADLEAVHNIAVGLLHRPEG
ncbi:hypothetical protein [Actinoplanes regularis]